MIGAKPTPTGEDAIQKSKRERDELVEEVAKVEDEVEALKAKYEMYFLGVERLEPARWRDEAKKKVLRLKSAFTRNTGLRFRIQSLHARYLSYERLWLRGAREKEEGTYRRDVFKARLHARERSREAGEPPAPAQPDAPVAKAATAGGKTAPSPARAAPPAPPTPPAGGDPQLRALYDAYVSAKKRCNEDVSRLTYEAVARSVTKQVPELMARFKARSVEFKVEVKDGKAILKAIPKL